MQIPASDGHIRVPSRLPHLGQRTSSGQCMANKSVPPVVDGQALPVFSKHPARRPKLLPERMPGEHQGFPPAPHRHPEWIRTAPCAALSARHAATASDRLRTL